MDIIGAGLTGLIAAHIWPNAQLYEVAAGPSPSHQALLRFRTDAVANTVGVEFKRVMVRKGIWMGRRFLPPDIQLANLYSLKCLGYFLPDRSIWNIDPVERFIAPEHFYEVLVENVERRISWGVNFFSTPGGSGTQPPIISTAPLPAVLEALHLPSPHPFLRSAITVQRFRVPNCEAYQTIYFPTPAHSMYRASITGDLLIVEHSEEVRGLWLDELLEAFALRDQLTRLSEVRQSYGKIAPIPDADRKRLLFELTRQFNIFSLGRFACWRNTLLDDVIDDARVIKRLMRSSSLHYEGFKS